MIWMGTAVLRLGDGHPYRKTGHTGAFAPFACEKDGLEEAISALRSEFEQNDLIMIGLREFLPEYVIDRVLTEYEQELVDGLQTYPVQFRDVHIYKDNE